MTGQEQEQSGGWPEPPGGAGVEVAVSEAG